MLHITIVFTLILKLLVLCGDSASLNRHHGEILPRVPRCESPHLSAGSPCCSPSVSCDGVHCLEAEGAA